ncbi:putative threonyl-tRNA synthetase 1, cytoplasmic [Coemansia reversa NRRL 1564]|uniref:threonine--tRNA ligase n=1 Tax=Coemansia reversa (strain ATCC 12441 / NRRL 1564) TaxID=763665 RepID=A0A2G5BKP8_COERN|nr:putative threonyl-tRNA synthetase 1, cytoplasmic [Coemansia reversa NRRL 1564]|eukprot:PIA19337.1 putative threonyl-tRNA synthetase 1, cytoplasmic [Coemansia reversa NRRL 1564]
MANASRPLDLARTYDQKNSKKYIAALLNNTTVWDMQRPLPSNTRSLGFLQFDNDNKATKDVLWHSSAHVMGAALEKIYGDDILLCDGPPLTEGGFFYEFLLLDSVRHATLNRLDRDTLFTIAQEKHTFERMEVDYDLAYELFLDNPFKLHFLDRVRRLPQYSNGSESLVFSVYRCGNFIDLCRGPHVVHTAQMQAFMMSRISSAHWVGHLSNNDANDSNTPQQKSPVLNRIYGISFPAAKQLKEYQKRLELAAQRDHRAIGKEQKLFMMHPWAPGSGFILPHGLRMVNTILTSIRRKYAKYGFDEVSTPLMFNRRLWETSGHWENYRDDMFTISAESIEMFGLKPMNCPGHCLIFASDQRSYKDLPVRYADFSPLHRNEIAGALSGLTRVRKFHQDDGHIFCMRSQVESEIEDCLRLISEMYEIFGFISYEFTLSTRPEKFIGNTSEWDEAEAALMDALHKSGKPWTLNAGDGAFYGPKIDVRVHDALGRKHQTATIQLDFQLPQRFQLKYIGSDGQSHQPVMIHRAVLGSMERMLAILIEHWGGKWPFWINPRQAIVIPTTIAVSAEANDKNPESVDSHRFFVDIDTSGSTLNRAVRQAQLAQYSYILVVGEKELSSGTVDVRQRQGGRVGTKTIAEVKAMFQHLVETYQ